ncbi:hypothetical protein V9T40_013104 [Parthenolecanium corni]|uniref:Fibroblast growth factor n=1 Tax=Parthenolecanium corni TaxID=536013 RepID=A0AAN9TIH3_9HEMI
MHPQLSLLTDDFGIGMTSLSHVKTVFSVLIVELSSFLTSLITCPRGNFVFADKKCECDASSEARTNLASSPLALAHEIDEHRTPTYRTPRPIPSAHADSSRSFRHAIAPSARSIRPVAAAAPTVGLVAAAAAPLPICRIRHFRFPRVIHVRFAAGFTFRFRSRVFSAPFTFQSSKVRGEATRRDGTRSDRRQDDANSSTRAVQPERTMSQPQRNEYEAKASGLNPLPQPKELRRRELRRDTTVGKNDTEIEYFDYVVRMRTPSRLSPPEYCGRFSIRSTTTTTTTTTRTSSELVRRHSSNASVGCLAAGASAGPRSWTPTFDAAAADTAADSPSTSSKVAAKLGLPADSTRIEPGFKHYGPRMRLYCRTGFCITILADGTVIGDPLANHTSGVLEFTSAGIGEIRIRGVEANLYLAMNAKGSLYGEEDPRDYATVFVEGTYGQYNTYLSQKYAHRGWYVGIKKSGAIKKASQTKWGQKAIQFLSLRA